MATWRDRAIEEIQSIKPYWAEKYGWDPRHFQHEDHIDLFVRFNRHHPDGVEPTIHVIRLRYESNYESAGRHEEFVDPDNYKSEGANFWPDGIRGINNKRKQRTICLSGTWGYHSIHHRDHPKGLGSLNHLLLELQKCLQPS